VRKKRKNEITRNKMIKKTFIMSLKDKKRKLQVFIIFFRREKLKSTTRWKKSIENENNKKLFDDKILLVDKRKRSSFEISRAFCSLPPNLQLTLIKKDFFHFSKLNVANN
jgi:hypothetical protein